MGAFNGYPSATAIDRAADTLLIYSAADSAIERATPNKILGLTSAPAGLTDSQTMGNKTFSNTNAYTAKDGSFILQNTADTTKQAVFSLSGITTGTTRTFTLPNASDILAGLTATQTLTNKTLTSPTINSPTITNATISADTLSGFTTSNNGTIYGMSVTGGLLASAAIAGQVNTAAIASSAVDYTKVATGFVVQVATTNYSAVATGTTILPYDDTIPQNTEGDQYMTQAITPKSATNHLLIEATCYITNSFAGTQDLSAALFQDTTANAIAVGFFTNSGGAGFVSGIKITYDMVAGTTSSTTFKVRAGASQAGTTTFNGAGGNRRFGGITISNIKITEYKA